VTRDTTGNIPDTVYTEIVREYHHYPSYHPEIWYYGPRYHRWRDYYYTPYWHYDYRNNYWSNYWYDYWQRRYAPPVAPVGSSSPTIKAPTSKRRRLRFTQPAPAPATTKKSQPVYQSGDQNGDSSGDDAEEEEQKEKKKKSNKRKKLKW
jgi:hypothetical protein